jgi:hypothetical protein
MNDQKPIQYYSGPLHTRLYRLRTTCSENDPSSTIEPLLKAVFYYPPTLALTEIKMLRTELETASLNIEKNLRTLTRFNIFSQQDEPYSDGEVDICRRSLWTELNAYEEALTKLEEDLQGKLISNSDDKIPTTFTVDELAYLFRLLHEEGKIPTATRVALYDKVRHTFTSIESKDIGGKYIKRKFESPDSKTIKEMEVFLQQLQTRIRQHKKNGVVNPGKKTKSSKP